METRTNIHLSLDEGLAVEREMLADGESPTLAAAVGVPRACLARLSVDARRKRDVHFVATAALGSFPDIVPLADRPAPSLRGTGVRPIVVGAGPAGLFAALWLAEAGLAPILVERGAPVDERRGDVEHFCHSRVLSPDSNVQFGEGGAGAFSDGKLSTGIKSPLVPTVLETLVAAGAPRDILWRARPHIGTDVLAGVVRTLRRRIIACGGEVRFHTRLVGLETSGSRVTAVRLQVSGGAQAGSDIQADSGARAGSGIRADSGIQAGGGIQAERHMPAGGDTEEHVATSAVVLATGHSARDVFSMLDVLGVELAPKAFSIGVRIEHLQSDIDRAQYGVVAGHPALGPAEYRLATHLADGRGVYTFCMCPGGDVVAAASEPGRLCVNGMSMRARDGANANAALLCSVNPDDYAACADDSAFAEDVAFGGCHAYAGGDSAYVGDSAYAESAAHAGGSVHRSGAFVGALAGVAFQRYWERAAFLAGGGDWSAPAMCVGDFLAGDRTAVGDGTRMPTGDSTRTYAGGAAAVEPTYPLGVRETDLSAVLPSFAVRSLREALPLLDRKLHGFASAGAVLTGIESRSSSPVRIERDSVTLQARGMEGLYPCGEGAGHAGGIVSAAVDGIHCAQALIDAGD